MRQRQGRTLAIAGIVTLTLGACGVAHAQTGAGSTSGASGPSVRTSPSPGGEPLRDGLTVPRLTRLVAPIGVTGIESDTAWYAVLVVDQGVDPRQPLETLAAQAQEAGYARARQSDTTVELVGLSQGALRTVRLGAVGAQGIAPAYVQVVVTSSPRTTP